VGRTSIPQGTCNGTRKLVFILIPFTAYTYTPHPYQPRSTSMSSSFQFLARHACTFYHKPVTRPLLVRNQSQQTFARWDSYCLLYVNIQVHAEGFTPQKLCLLALLRGNAAGLTQISTFHRGVRWRIQALRKRIR
jgi:hypothetical protein